MKEKNTKEKVDTISIELDKNEELSIPEEFYENEVLEFEQKGHYSVKNEIGKGGTGKVFLATDNFIGRSVALKELLPLSTPKIHYVSAKDLRARNRFLKEAKITGQLEHPGIAPVYEIGRKPNGKLYYTMRLVKGKTLSKAILDAESLNERLRLLTHFRDICNTIAYAHSKNVIHRDIKPANIMIGEFGETVMLDWGLAKVKGEMDEKAEEIEEGIKLLKLDIDVTVKGKIMGTPAYMSPEQAKGDISSVDELSDIYSLGAVLYEILSGKIPYSGKSIDDILKNIEDSNIPDIDALLPAVPPELCAILQKSFIKERSKRYKTALELSRDIENYMSGNKVAAYEYSSFELIKKFFMKNKTISLLIAFIVVILIVTTVLISLSYAESVNKEKTAHYNLALGYEAWARQMILTGEYEKGAIFAAAALFNNPYNFYSPLKFRNIKMFKKSFISEKTLNGRSLYYIASLKSSDALISTIYLKTVPNDIKVLSDGKSVVFGGRDRDITFFDIESKKELFKLKGHQDEVYSIDVSSDGSKLLSGSWDGSVILWDISKREEIKRYVFHKNEIYKVKLSHSGRLGVSGGSDKDVVVFNLQSGKIVYTLKAHTKGINNLSFSLNDRYLVSSGYDGVLNLWDMETGENVAKYVSDNNVPISFASFSEKDDVIIVTDYQGNITILNRNNLLVERFFKLNEAIFSATLIPGTESILVSGTDNILKKFNLKTGKTEEIYRGHDKLINAISFIDQKDSFVTVSRDETIKLWKENSTKKIRLFKGGDSVISDMKVSPDGQNLIASDRAGYIFLWKKKGDLKPKVIKAHKKIIESIDFSSDGKFFASGSWDKSVKIWETSSGNLLKTIKSNNNAIYSVKFAPDNTKIAFGTWDNVIKVVDWRVGRVLQIIKSHSNSIQAVDFSTDGDKLISASRNGEIIENNLVKNSSKIILKSNLKITDIALSPIDKKIVFSSDNGSITILSKNGEIKEIPTECPTVNSVSFSEDGQYIIASACATSIFTSTGVAVLSIPLNYIGYASELSKDSRYIYTSSGNEVLKLPFDKEIWKKDPEKLIERGERRAGKSLSGFYLK